MNKYLHDPFSNIHIQISQDFGAILADTVTFLTAANINRALGTNIASIADHVEYLVTIQNRVSQLLRLRKPKYHNTKKKKNYPQSAARSNSIISSLSGQRYRASES